MTKDRPPSINETKEIGSSDKVEKIDLETKKPKEEFDLSFMDEKKQNSHEISEQDIQTFEKKEKATEDTTFEFDYLDKPKDTEKKEKNKKSNEVSEHEEKTNLKKQIKEEAIEEIIDVAPSVKGLKFAKKTKEKLDEQETKRQEAELGQVEIFKEDKLEDIETKEKELEIQTDEKAALKQNLEAESMEKRKEKVEAEHLQQKQREGVLEQEEKPEKHMEEVEKENPEGHLENERHMEEVLESNIETTEEKSVEQLDSETTEEKLVEQLGIETTEEPLKEQKVDDLEQSFDENQIPRKIPEDVTISELDIENMHFEKSIERSNVKLEQQVEAKTEHFTREKFEKFDKDILDEGERPSITESSEKKSVSFFDQMIEKRFEGFRDFQDKHNRWNELSDTERMAALEDLKSTLVDYMGIKKEPPIEFKELKEGVYGGYSNKTVINLQNIGTEKLVTKEEKIELNTRYLDDSREMAKTLIHELQHAKQDQTVDAVYNVSKHSMYKPTIENRINYYLANPELNPVKVWDENIKNYKDPDEHGIEEYRNQPIEEDARFIEEKLEKIVLNERDNIQSPKVQVEQTKIGNIMELPTKHETQQFFQEKLKNIEKLENHDISNPHNIEYKKIEINNIWEEACRDYQLYDAPTLDLNEFEAKLINPEKNEVAIGKYDKNDHSIKLDGKYLTSLSSNELQEVFNEHFQEAIKLSENKRAKVLESYKHSLYEKLEENQFNTLERWNDKSLFEKVNSFNELEKSILEEHSVDLKIKIVQEGTLDAGNVMVNLDQKEINLSMKVLQDEQSIKNVIANNLAEMKMKEWAVPNSEIRFEKYSKGKLEQKEKLEVSQKFEIKELEEPLAQAELYMQYKDYIVSKADVFLPQEKWTELTSERDKKSEMTQLLQDIFEEGDFDINKIEFQRNVRRNSGNPQLDFIYEENSREIIMERNLLNEYTRDEILESFAKSLAERKIELVKNTNKRIEKVQNHYEEQIHFFLENEYDIDDEYGIGFFVEDWEFYNESEKIERVQFIIEKFSNEPGIKNSPDVVFETFDSEDETFRYDRYDNTIILDRSLLNDPDELIKGISRGLAKTQELERESIESGTYLFDQKPDLDEIRNLGEDIWYGNNRSTYSHIFDGHIDENGNVSGIHYDGKDTINTHTNVENEYKNARESDRKPFNAKTSITLENQNGQSIKYFKNNISTMFPRNMSPGEVIDSVNEAYIDAKYTGKGNQWRGVSSNGMPIVLYLDDNYRIISAFPEL